MKKAFTLIELLIVVAIIAILAAIAVPNFLEAQTRAKVSRVLSDERTYSTALETYYIDNNAYPYHIARGGVTGQATYPTGIDTTNNYNAQVLLSGGKAVGNWNNIPTFAIGQGGRVLGLTSPVSYLSAHTSDAFGSDKSVTFAYAQGPAGFLVWSPGPDGVDQLDGSLNGSSNNSNAAEWMLHGGQSLPSNYLTAGPGGVTGSPTGAPTSGDSFTYDATNGTASAGDVYKTKG